jgi:DNA repair and recombination RAD54-like protein
LRALFELNSNTISDTHDKLKCKRCFNGSETVEPPPNADTNSDLSHWYHNTNKDTRKLPDQILREIYKYGAISFIFHQKSHEQVKETIGETADEATDETTDIELDDDER